MTAMELYAAAHRLAWNRNQVVGKKSDYYITIQQLDQLIRKLDKAELPNDQR